MNSLSHETALNVTKLAIRYNNFIASLLKTYWNPATKFDIYKADSFIDLRNINLNFNANVKIQSNDFNCRQMIPDGWCENNFKQPFTHQLHSQTWSLTGEKIQLTASIQSDSDVPKLKDGRTYQP